MPSKKATNSFRPPSEWKTSLKKLPSSNSSRSSVSVKVIPLFKKASSRKRPAKVSYLYSVVCVKIVGSGLKVTIVPLLSVVPISLTSYCGTPISYSCTQILPSRCTSAFKCVDNALTQLTPTPCKPPETL
ncbi:hypothetical protein D3C86_341630 [compost metagenome]